MVSLSYERSSPRSTNHGWVVMYIPAVPYTQANAAYIMKQKDSFIQGNSPSDYPTSEGEREFVGVGKLDDIMSEAGRMATGFAVDVDA